MKWLSILVLSMIISGCGIFPSVTSGGGTRCIMPVCNLPGAQNDPRLKMTVPCCKTYVRMATCRPC